MPGTFENWLGVDEHGDRIIDRAGGAGRGGLSAARRRIGLYSRRLDFYSASYTAHFSCCAGGVLYAT